MLKAAETSFPTPVAAGPELRPLRVVPDEDPAEKVREALINRLAADRLRDLRDDGLTMAYVARMYDVEAGLLERLTRELAPVRRR